MKIVTRDTFSKQTEYQKELFNKHEDRKNEN